MCVLYTMRASTPTVLSVTAEKRITFVDAQLNAYSKSMPTLWKNEFLATFVVNPAEKHGRAVNAGSKRER